MKIIDAHTHPQFTTPWEDPYLLRLSRRSIAEIVSDSRAAGIEQMVVLGDILRFGPNPEPEQVREINEDTAQLMRDHPDFFIGYCYLNPQHDESVLRAEAQRFIVEGGFCGIKLEVDMVASDPRLGTLMELAEELNVVVLQHAWWRRGAPASDAKGKANSDGADVAVLASRHPRVRIQMAHLTGVGIRGVEAIRPHENVWVDTSGALPFSGFTEYAVNRLGEDRVIYGSDYPIRDLTGQLSKVASARIPERLMAKLFRENFREMHGFS